MQNLLELSKNQKLKKEAQKALPSQCPRTQIEDANTQSPSNLADKSKSFLLGFATP